MSKGIELELYFAISLSRERYKQKIARITTHEGFVLEFTIDHNAQGEAIIELICEPILKKDDEVADKKLAVTATAIVDLLQKIILRSQHTTISITAIKSQFIMEHSNWQFEILDDEFRLDTHRSRTYLLEHQTEKKDMLAHLQVNFSAKSQDLSRLSLIKYLTRTLDPVLPIATGYNIVENFLQCWERANHEANQLNDNKSFSTRKFRKIRGILFAAYLYDAGINAKQVMTSDYDQPCRQPATNLANLSVKDLHGLVCKTSEFLNFLSYKDLHQNRLFKFLAAPRATPKIMGRQANLDDREETLANFNIYRNFILETRSYKVGAIFNLQTLESHIYENLRRFGMENFPQELIDLANAFLEEKNVERAAKIILDLYYSLPPATALALIRKAKQLLNTIEFGELTSLLRQGFETQDPSFKNYTLEYLENNKEIIALIYQEPWEEIIRSTAPAIYNIVQNNLQDAKACIESLTEKDEKIINEIFIFCCDMGNIELIKLLFEKFKPLLKLNLFFHDNQTPFYLLLEKGHMEIVELILQECPEETHSLILNTLSIAKNSNHIEIQIKIIKIWMQVLQTSRLPTPYLFLKTLFDLYPILLNEPELIWLKDTAGFFLEKEKRNINTLLETISHNAKPVDFEEKNRLIRSLKKLNHHIQRYAELGAAYSTHIEKLDLKDILHSWKNFAAKIFFEQLEKFIDSRRNIRKLFSPLLPEPGPQAAEELKAFLQQEIQAATTDLDYTEHKERIKKYIFDLLQQTCPHHCNDQSEDEMSFIENMLTRQIILENDFSPIASAKQEIGRLNLLDDLSSNEDLNSSEKLNIACRQ